MDKRTLRLHTLQRFTEWLELGRWSGRVRQAGPVIELEVGHRAASYIL